MLRDETYDCLREIMHRHHEVDERKVAQQNQLKSVEVSALLEHFVEVHFCESQPLRGSETEEKFHLIRTELSLQLSLMRERGLRTLRFYEISRADEPN